MKLQLTRKQGDPDRCGYGWFSTCDDDMFNIPCINHDRHYMLKDCTLKEADDQFEREVLEIVANEKNYWHRQTLRARAYLYIGIVKSLGWMFWYT